MFSFTKKGIRFKKYTPSELAIRRVMPKQITLPVGELFLMPGDRVFGAKAISTLDGREVAAPCNGRFVGVQSVKTANGDISCAVILPDAQEPMTFAYNSIDMPSMEQLLRAAEKIAPILPELPPLATRLQGLFAQPVAIRAVDDGPDRAAANAVLCGYLKEIVSAVGWLERSGADVTLYTNNLNVKSYVQDRATDVTIRSVSGKYPSDVWLKQRLAKAPAVVLDVREVYALFHTIAYGCPPPGTVVTVCTWGKALQAVEVPIGTPASAVFDALAPDMRLIANGVLCGTAVLPETPITPMLDALTLLSPVSARASTCMACGQCVRHCPMGLSPYLCNQQAAHASAHTARQYGADRCIACGACDYVCPSKLPLRQMMANLAEVEQHA